MRLGGRNDVDRCSAPNSGCEDLSVRVSSPTAWSELRPGGRCEGVLPGGQAIRGNVPMQPTAPFDA
jgi:hypothetical protein